MAEILVIVMKRDMKIYQRKMTQKSKCLVNVYLMFVNVYLTLTVIHLRNFFLSIWNTYTYENKEVTMYYHNKTNVLRTFSNVLECSKKFLERSHIEIENIYKIYFQLYHIGGFLQILLSILQARID